MIGESDEQIPGIVPALIVIGIGVVFLLNNLNIFYMHDIWRYWPVILIAAGLAKMVDSPHSNGRLTGGVLIGVGGLFLADTLGFLNLSWRDFWPLVLIGAGLVMLWSRLAPPPAGVPDIPASGHEGALNEYAIFGGVERKVTTDDFRGGHVSAMFGGVEVDLRRAGMRGDSAVIDVNAMFGGVEFKIPHELGGGAAGGRHLRRLQQQERAAQRGHARGEAPVHQRLGGVRRRGSQELTAPMHPILAKRGRILLYLAGWIPVLALLDYLMWASGSASWVQNTAVLAPACVLFAFACLSPWPICRVRPLRLAGAAMLVATWAAAAVAASALFTGAAWALARIEGQPGRAPGSAVRRGHPALPALRRTALRGARRRGVARGVRWPSPRRKRWRATRSCTPCACRSIRTFCSTACTRSPRWPRVDGARAREMCIRLSDFLRSSLGLGERESVPLREELALARSYLEVEQVRFGARLQFSEDIQESCRIARSRCCCCSRWWKMR